MQNITIDHVAIEIAATKADAGYDYEGPIEDMPRNISPAIIIAGLPGALITHISMDHMVIKHPGAGNPMFAKVALDALDSIPEKPAAYPDFSTFHELPAWGIFIRHARDIQFSNLVLSCTKKDYRTAIVLDDVHHAAFMTTAIKEPGTKKSSFQQHSSEIIFK